METKGGPSSCGDPKRWEAEYGVSWGEETPLEVGGTGNPPLKHPIFDLTTNTFDLGMHGSSREVGSFISLDP